MIISGEKPYTEPVKPKTTPILTTGGLVVAGTTGGGGGVIAYQNGAADPASITLIGLSVLTALATLIGDWMAKKKAVQAAPLPTKQTPMERLADLIEQRTFINAQITEAAEEIRDDRRAEDDLLGVAEEPLFTIEHEATPPVVQTIGAEIVKTL